MSFKRANVHKLPTNDKSSRLVIDDNSGRLNYLEPNDALWGHNHLYITSSDKSDKIKEDDWCISKLNEVIQFKKNYDSSLYKKIIATTDISLKIIKSATGYTETRSRTFFSEKSLPQLSQAFIEKYVSEYNKGNVITDVLVEQSFKKNVVFGNMSFLEINGDGSYYKCINCEVETTKSREFLINSGCIVDELKISKDNTITIKKVKDSWNREEVHNLLMQAWINGVADKSMDYTVREKWIEENL